MKMVPVLVDQIIVEGDRRALNEERIKQLAQSIADIGLMMPLSIWVDDGGFPRLIAGNHRLAAVKELGHEEVACVIVSMDELGRQCGTSTRT